MRDNDYMDLLKTTDLRPKKYKVKESEMVILNESLKEAADIENKDLVMGIIKWLKANPKPSDDEVHNFAEEIGLNPHELETHIYMILGDILSEGKSKGFTGEYNEHELVMGVEVEMEHTTIPCIARKIAQDHLVEIPDYYSRLKRMEEQAGIKEGLQGPGGKFGFMGEEGNKGQMGEDSNSSEEK
jgi:hypothetical protein